MHSVKRLLTLGFALVIAVVTPSFSQTPPTAQRLSFEVASIKPNKSGSSSSSMGSDDSSFFFRATNLTARDLVLEAFRIRDFQLIDSPSWLGAERFDIEARAEDRTVAALRKETVEARSSMMIQMLQSLLEDRFAMKFHKETRELPVFILTVAKDGPKLQPTIEGRPGPGGLKPGSSHINGTPSGAEMSGGGITIERLVNMIASQVGRPVIDRTKLTGMFDFSVKWAPVRTASTSQPGNLTSPEEPSGPSIFTALQEQLGLKLQSERSPVEVVVIDSIQRPSEN